MPGATPAAMPLQGRAAEGVYAGFGRRVGAYLIDMLAFMLVAVPISIVAGFADPTMADQGDARLDLLLMIIGFVVTAGMESSRLQGTPGKLALGLVVTDLAGRRISFWRATGRYFAEILNSLTLGVGYLMAAFTKRRQALHDIVAGTLVVHKRVDAAVIAAGGETRSLSGWAVAGLAAVALIPIAGILAAISLPAYDAYQVRAQVVDALSLVARHKEAVATAWLSSPLEFDEIHTATIGAGLPTSGRYVESIEIDTGAVIITFGGEADEQLQGHILTLVPAVDQDRAIGWVCGYGDPPRGFQSIFEDSGEFTDVPDEFLPGICRRTNALRSAPPPATEAQTTRI